MSIFSQVRVAVDSAMATVEATRKAINEKFDGKITALTQEIASINRRRAEALSGINEEYDSYIGGVKNELRKIEQQKETELVTSGLMPEKTSVAEVVGSTVGNGVQTGMNGLAKVAVGFNSIWSKAKANALK